jgi:cytochrome c-type biogenesis protein CcmH
VSARLRQQRGHDRRSSRATLIALCASAALAAGAGAGAGAGSAAAASRPSLPAIERQVMCVTCKIPLQVAESPQADRERAFIRELIGRGYDEAAIKHALVQQYGSTVLALPSDNGFDATAYIVPLAACLALLALLLVLLPRWRRRARAQARAREPAPTLSAADAQRLDADLERFD